MTSRTGKALIQLAAVLFLLNTATAYGACCFSVSEDESDAEMTMPCHQADDDETAEPSGECCLMCLTMALEDSVQNVSQDQRTVVALSRDMLLRISFDPPFRPPIHHLS